MEPKNMILMAVIVIAGLVISQIYKRKVTKKALERSKAEEAARNFSDSDIEVLYKSDFAECIKHLEGKKVLAANYVYHLPDAKEHMKTAGKDVLKSALTLGTVKFTTVQVPVPLLLAEDGLHIFQLNTEEKVTKHMLFGNDRLLQATIRKENETRIPTELGDAADFFTLSIPSDEGMRELYLCSVLYPTQTKFLTYNPYRRLLAYATGKHFFKVLAEKFPNLAA